MTDLYKETPYLAKVVAETGYETINSLLLLHHIVKNIDPEIVLELGTGLGCSTIFMALGLGKGKVVSVDDYRGDVTSDINNVYHNLKMCKVSDKVKLIKGNTTEALLPSYYPEVVFMDASHNVPDLKLEYYSLLFPKDHVVIIDDIFSVGVNDFVLSLADQYEFGFILKFHNGVAVLISNKDKYLSKVNNAIWSSIHE